MRSLKGRLIGLWGLSLLSSLVLGALLVSLYRQSTEAQVGRAQAVLARACDLIRDRYAFYVAGWTGPAEAMPTRRLQRTWRPWSTWRWRGRPASRAASGRPRRVAGLCVPDL